MTTKYEKLVYYYLPDQHQLHNNRILALLNGRLTPKIAQKLRRVRWRPSQRTAHFSLNTLDNGALTGNALSIICLLDEYMHNTD